MERRMLLDSTLDQSPACLDAEASGSHWQDYLAEQTASHPLFRRRQLAFAAGKGHVVLTGTVNSFYEKQLAQEFVRRCDGVQLVDNRIDVAYA
jgi:osmotically-inducible protein OsmY